MADTVDIDLYADVDHEFAQVTWFVFCWSVAVGVQYYSTLLLNKLGYAYCKNTNIE